MAKTLEEHLGLGYDFLVRSARDKWSPNDFVTDLQSDPDLLTAAQKKLDELESLKNVTCDSFDQRCFISSKQHKILADALRTLDTL